MYIYCVLYYAIILEVTTIVETSREETFKDENYKYSVNSTEIIGKFNFFLLEIIIYTYNNNEMLSILYRVFRRNNQCYVR